MDQEESNEYLQQQLFTQEQIRKQAFIRQTAYEHSLIKFNHEPISSKQCDQLQKQLDSLYKPRVEQVRRHYDPTEVQKMYQNAYGEFLKMMNRNQAQQKVTAQNIKQMHQMADILLNPPPFSQQLFLYNKTKPIVSQQEQINSIFDQYQKAYKLGQKIQDNQANQTIKRAKLFLLQRNI